MNRKILIAFFVLEFVFLLYSNLIRHLLFFTSFPILIPLLVDVLLVLLFCGYYFKLFGPSKFELNKGNLLVLLKSCGLFITFYILACSLDLSFIDSIITKTYDFSYVMISKDALTLMLKERYFYLILTLVMAPVTEEIIFRGLLQEYLSRKNFPVWVIILLPAALFTLIHFRLTNIHLLFLGGCLYGFIYHKYRNISINIICHSLWNLLVLLFKTGGQLSVLFVAIYITAGISFFLLLRTMIKEASPVTSRNQKNLFPKES